MMKNNFNIKRLYYFYTMKLYANKYLSKSDSKQTFKKSNGENSNLGLSEAESEILKLYETPFQPRK